MPIEEHKVVVEQELMRKVIVRVLNNNTNESEERTEAAMDTCDLISELED